MKIVRKVDAKILREISAILREGGLVVYPTDTLYALGADVYNREAVKKVYTVKKRPLSLPLPIALSSVDEIKRVAEMSAPAYKFCRKHLPGAITVLLPSKLPQFQEKVGIRVPACDVALKLLRECGPLTATSANLHRGTPPKTVEHAQEQLGKDVDVYVDGGECLGIPSTVVDITDLPTISLIREGTVPFRRLMQDG